MSNRARIAELFRYGVATAISASITLGVPVLLIEGLGVEPRLAVAVALVSGLAVTFATTRRFVFRSSGNARGDLARFATASVGFRIGEYLLFLALFASGFVYYVAQIVVVAVSFGLKYLTFKKFVYSRRRAADIP